MGKRTKKEKNKDQEDLKKFLQVTKQYVEMGSGEASATSGSVVAKSSKRITRVVEQDRAKRKGKLVTKPKPPRIAKDQFYRKMGTSPVSADYHKQQVQMFDPQNYSGNAIMQLLKQGNFNSNTEKAENMAMFHNSQIPYLPMVQSPTINPAAPRDEQVFLKLYRHKMKCYNQETEAHATLKITSSIIASKEQLKNMFSPSSGAQLYSKMNMYLKLIPMDYISVFDQNDKNEINFSHEDINNCGVIFGPKAAQMIQLARKNNVFEHGFFDIFVDFKAFMQRQPINVLDWNPNLVDEKNHEYRIHYELKYTKFIGSAKISTTGIDKTKKLKNLHKALKTDGVVLNHLIRSSMIMFRVVHQIFHIIVQRIRNKQPKFKNQPPPPILIKDVLLLKNLKKSSISDDDFMFGKMLYIRCLDDQSKTVCSNCRRFDDKSGEGSTQKESGSQCVCNVKTIKDHQSLIVNNDGFWSCPGNCGNVFTSFMKCYLCMWYTHLSNEEKILVDDRNNGYWTHKLLDEERERLKLPPPSQLDVDNFIQTHLQRINYPFDAFNPPSKENLFNCFPQKFKGSAILEEQSHLFKESPVSLSAKLAESFPGQTLNEFDHVVYSQMLDSTFNENGQVALVFSGAKIAEYQHSKDKMGYMLHYGTKAHFQTAHYDKQSRLDQLIQDHCVPITGVTYCPKTDMVSVYCEGVICSLRALATQKLTNGLAMYCEVMESANRILDEFAQESITLQSIDSSSIFIALQKQKGNSNFNYVAKFLLRHPLQKFEQNASNQITHQPYNMAYPQVIDFNERTSLKYFRLLDKIALIFVFLLHFATKDPRIDVEKGGKKVKEIQTFYNGVYQGCTSIKSDKGKQGDIVPQFLNKAQMKHNIVTKLLYELTLLRKKGADIPNMNFIQEIFDSKECVSGFNETPDQIFQKLCLYAEKDNTKSVNKLISKVLAPEERYQLLARFLQVYPNAVDMVLIEHRSYVRAIEIVFAILRKFNFKLRLIQSNDDDRVHLRSELLKYIVMAYLVLLFPLRREECSFVFFQNLFSDSFISVVTLEKCPASQTMSGRAEKIFLLAIRHKKFQLANNDISIAKYLCRICPSDERQCLYKIQMEKTRGFLPSAAKFFDDDDMNISDQYLREKNKFTVKLVGETGIKDILVSTRTNISVECFKGIHNTEFNDQRILSNDNYMIKNNEAYLERVRKMYDKFLPVILQLKQGGNIDGEWIIERPIVLTKNHARQNEEDPFQYRNLMIQQIGDKIHSFYHPGLQNSQTIRLLLIILNGAFTSAFPGIPMSMLYQITQPVDVSLSTSKRTEVSKMEDHPLEDFEEYFYYFADAFLLTHPFSDQNISLKEFVKTMKKVFTHLLKLVAFYFDPHPTMVENAKKSLSYNLELVTDPVYYQRFAERFNEVGNDQVLNDIAEMVALFEVLIYRLPHLLSDEINAHLLTNCLGNMYLSFRYGCVHYTTYLAYIRQNFKTNIFSFAIKNEYKGKISPLQRTGEFQQSNYIRLLMFSTNPTTGFSAPCIGLQDAIADDFSSIHVKSLDKDGLNIDKKCEFNVIFNQFEETSSFVQAQISAKQIMLAKSLLDTSSALSMDIEMSEYEDEQEPTTVTEVEKEVNNEMVEEQYEYAKNVQAEQILANDINIDAQEHNICKELQQEKVDKQQ